MDTAACKKVYDLKPALAERQRWQTRREFVQKIFRI